MDGLAIFDDGFTNARYTIIHPGSGDVFISCSNPYKNRGTRVRCINIRDDTGYTIEEYIEKARQDTSLLGVELKTTEDLPNQVQWFLKKIIAQVTKIETFI